MNDQTTPVPVAATSSHVFVDAERKLLAFGPIHDMGAKDKKPVYCRAVMGLDNYGRHYVSTELLDENIAHDLFRDTAVVPEKGIVVKFSARCEELARAYLLAKRPA
jgi:hypothetical protein